jgi:glycosyltransferase involved in cell wall biosynthesis
MIKVILYGPQPPFFSYGGPVRSLNSLRKVLFLRFDTICISPNKELNGDFASYDSKNKILYSSYPFSTLLYNCLKYPRSLVWFNSFFDYKLLFLLIFSRLGFCKIVLSPRGELSSAAIESSRPKLKYLYIKIFQRLVSSREIFFHATDSLEFQNIKVFFKTKKTKVIPNISSQNYFHNNCYENNFVFFSRICKKKGLLELLNYIKSENLKINLDIYGFKEDYDYWIHCKKLIDGMKGINYCGELPQGSIEPLVSKYTFFILPTYNENFGHAIFEAIALGLIPVLSKGTTPFDKDIDELVGLNFDLASSTSLKNSLIKSQSFSQEEIDMKRVKLYEYFKKLLKKQKKFEQYYITFITDIIGYK